MFMSPNGEAHLLTPTQFEFYWPAISADMDRVRHTWEIWWTKEALFQAVMDGYINVWAIGSPTEIHLVLFTQIHHCPANTILKIILLIGNNLDKYYDIAEATIEKFAMDRGCTYIETCSRDGFKRRIKNVFYHGVVLTRKLGTIKVQ